MTEIMRRYCQTCGDKHEAKGYCRYHYNLYLKKLKEIEKIIELRDQGESYANIAKKTQFSKEQVRKLYLKHKRETNDKRTHARTV